MEREGTTTTTHGRAPSFIIKRPRLTKLLDESEARIILLVAPAGYGKTTLAREWADRSSDGAAWYTTSSASADVATLAIGIATAVDSALADQSFSLTRRVSSLVTIHQKPDALARSIANGRRNWPRHLLVVIDDYHHLIASPAAEEFIAALVLMLPATFVIATRGRPSWFTPRLSVYGEGLELGMKDLELTNDEASDVIGDQLHAEAARSIWNLAHGWPAVISLAARSGREDFPKALPSELYEFLADDLIASTPDTVQDALTVLAATGIGDRRTAAALLGPTGEAAIIEAAQRGLLAFEGATKVLLHPLLADLLIARLQHQPTRLLDRADELMDLLADNCQWDECLAFALALPQKSFPLERILESSLDDLLEGGRISTLQRWVELARHSRTDAPIIDLADGEIALRAGEYDRAFTLGTRAARKLRLTDVFLSRAQLLAARAANLGDQRASAKEWFEAAESTAQSDSIRAAAVWGQFIGRFEREDGDLSAALQQLEAATDGSVAHEHRLAQARFLLGCAARSVDDALLATQKARSLLALPTDPLTRLATLNQHSWALGWAGRYREALAASEHSLVEANELAVDFVISHALLAKAVALVGLRRFGAAHETLAILARRLREEPDSWASTNVALVRSKLQISLGDLDRAADELVLDPDVQTSIGMRSEYDAFRALVEAARGSSSRARDHLERCARGSTHVDSYALAAVAEAILGAREGRAEHSIDELAKAFAAGHRDSVVFGCRAFPLLAQIVVSQGAHRNDLLTTLIGSNDDALAKSAGLHVPRTVIHGSKLSPREVEVYELLVQGCTNVMIAKTLFITQSTVKVHVQHIFEKLGVRSRVEATRAWQAGELGHEPTSDVEAARGSLEDRSD
jgi:LuxR family maltose regulon positive regulatory protein